MRIKKYAAILICLLLTASFALGIEAEILLDALGVLPVEARFDGRKILA